MYNGIGLVTPRGSGTNGYVQRNMAFVQKSREKVSYKTEEDIKKLDALANRKPNQGILAHERKRTIELKCLEMQELMEDQGYPDDEIEAKVAMFRQMLVDKEGAGEKEIPKDEFGRPLVKESHQIAEANQEKNSKMREALGISQYFVEGSSLDPERRTKEAAAAAAEEAKKKYMLIPDSSSSSSPERSQDREKDKKRKKKKSHSSREKEEESPKKKKSAKKHKKDRSVSPDVQKKKKVKKPVKEKSKHKSKSDATRKKQSARSSSSSSSSSSDSADDESSSRATSRDSQSDTSVERQKGGTKQSEKPQKANRKRSTSSERIRYSKDARSRKDIYEAKKDRHKRKSVRASSSSSSGDSSPKQYFRLEPVLLTSKSKRKKAHQIIEIPSTSAFELKKYEKKKRVRGSSSSGEEATRPESKRRKRSESPVVLKSSKHRSERDEAKVAKMDDSYKSSRRSEKDYHSAVPEKHRRDRSRSNGSQRKYHQKVQTISDDESDGHRKKGKERPKELVEERHHEKGSRGKKKHSRKELESPVRHNGYHKPPAKSQLQEIEDSDRSERSISAHKRKKNIPRSPSHSPVAYKNKKHIIKSPSYDPPHSHKKKSATKHHRPCQSVSKSPPPKRHDSDTSRSPSPTVSAPKRNGRDPKATNQTSRSNRTPPRRRDENQSPNRSPSQHRSTKTKSKQKSKRTERSSSRSVVSEGSDDPYEDRRARQQEWKSKGEVKEVSCRSRSHSPMHHKGSHTKSKKNRDPSEELSEMRILSPKNKKGMTIIVETCQISPSKESARPGNHNRDSLSASPVRVQSSGESKRQKRDKDAERAPNKSSPVWSKEKVASPRSEKSKRAGVNACQSSSNEIHEVKVKRGSPDDANIVMPVPSKEITAAEDAFTARKNNWNLITNSNNLSPSVSQTPLPRGPSAPRNEESATPVTKEDTKASSQKEGRRAEQSKDKRKASNYSPSRSRSVSENKEAEKGAKAKQRTPSRSRSRSTSVAHSRSGSERSSRSRSYSRRGTKSYSKSRSQSYSKSRSRSHSRSKTRSKSRSKSHSRSRSKSYSRSISIDSRSRSRSYSSRSRSRSNARSPSIPRRRGSPSFLDKRRITS